MNSCQGANDYTPLVNFQLAVLDSAEEARLKQQFHAAFAANITPLLAVFLDPVTEAEDQMNEIREDDGCDSIPLRGSRLIAEFGKVDI